MDAEVGEISKTISFKDMEKHIKKWTTILSLIMSLGGAFGVGAAFYYKTNYTIEALKENCTANTLQIGELTKLVNSISTKTEVNGVKPETLGKEVDEMNKRLDRLESKQDKMYDILLNIKKSQ